MAPTIDYARSGGLAIAYQVAGAGDVDLVYVPDYMSNLVYGWESPRWRGFYERLTRTFRLILFDKRGTGLSDHGGQFAALETRMEDLGAVHRATGRSGRASYSRQTRAAAWRRSTPRPTPSAHAPSSSFSRWRGGWD